MTPSRRPTVRPEVVGALASWVENGDGPSHPKLNRAIQLAGLQVPDAPNKPAKVQLAFERATAEQGRELIEQLIHVVRDEGYWARDDFAQQAKMTRAALGLISGRVSDEGFLTWDYSAGDAITSRVPAGAPPVPGPVTTLTAPPAPIPAAAPALVPGFVRPGTTRQAPPAHERLLSILRRVPASLKPLVGVRRTDQTSLFMKSEYDLQDAVEMALRLVYDDVRPEERAPSHAGASSTPDFVLPEVQTAVEVKVTYPGRKNNQVSKEIIHDTETYLKHPDVHRLVFVVYDLANTIVNPPGFERDLGGSINGHPRDTLVVEWPY